MSGGHRALRPGTLEVALFGLLAGVRAVFTHDDPVVGGGGDQDAQPPGAAHKEAANLRPAMDHRRSFTKYTK